MSFDPRQESQDEQTRREGGSSHYGGQEVEQWGKEGKERHPVGHAHLVLVTFLMAEAKHFTLPSQRRKGPFQLAVCIV